MKINKQVQAIIFADSQKEMKILLVKKLDLKNYTHRWRLLKGSVEDNEDEQSALIREINEEVGLKNFQILEKIYEYDFTFQDAVNRVHTFVVRADFSQPLEIQTSEIADARWMNKSDAKKILFWEHEKNALKKFEEIYHHR